MSRKYPQLYDPAFFQKLQDECGSDLAIAHKLGCHVRNVAYARKITGIASAHAHGGNCKRFPMLYDLDTFLKLQADCGSDAAIARKIGCTPATVRNARYTLGVPTTLSGHYFALLDRDAFFALRPEERTAADIAAELGCCIASVRAAYKRFNVQKAWHGKTNPMLRHPDVLAYLMARYNYDIIQIAEIAGSTPQSVRKAIVEFRADGYTF